MPKNIKFTTTKLIQAFAAEADAIRGFHLIFS